MLLANVGASFNFHLNNYRVQLMQHDAQRRLDLAAGTYPGYRTCDAGARQTHLPNRQSFTSSPEDGTASA